MWSHRRGHRGMGRNQLQRAYSTVHYAPIAFGRGTVIIIIIIICLCVEIYKECSTCHTFLWFIINAVTHGKQQNVDSFQTIHDTNTLKSLSTNAGYAEAISGPAVWKWEPHTALIRSRDALKKFPQNVSKSSKESPCLLRPGSKAFLPYCSYYYFWLTG